MPLSAGDKLGPYEILAPLGAGGMGEVYRARDPRLDREVAVKVLPAAMAQDPERLARLDREARVLASLNHPNIAHIYGFEESGGARALVMELVAGATLSVPQPLETALDYARQIAEALEAAHEKNITHRDLKPANVMVTPTGAIKVLDFGLATAPGREPDHDPANSPTLTFAATQAGMIMGTAGYMSPEQASGKTVDKRSDIWSFGVVLYEMLSGARLFQGETLSHTLADVLRAPIEFSGLPPATPPAVIELLKRCLDRDPRTRLRDIGEARIILERWRNHPPAPPVPQAPPRRAPWLPWTVAAAALALSTAAFLYRKPAPPPANRYALSVPTEGVDSSLPSVSPDGKWLAFIGYRGSAKGEVWLRNLESDEMRPLPDTEGVATLFWSPDSRSLGFIGNGLLRRVDRAGGRPLTLCDATGSGTWSRGGVIVFAPLDKEGLFEIPATGGTPRKILDLDTRSGERKLRIPWFLPDGRHYLVLSAHTDEKDAVLYAVKLGSKERIRVASIASNAQFAPAQPGSSSGHLLFLRNRSLLAQPFDARDLKITGEPFVVIGDVASSGWPGYRHANFSVSETGVLAHRRTAGPTTQPVWYSPDGKRESTAAESGRYFAPRLSPDGKRLFVGSSRDGATGLDVIDLTTGAVRRIAPGPSAAAGPWSPTGDRLAYTIFRDNRARIFVAAADGSGTPEKLFESENAIAADWSPDGASLALVTDGIDILPLNGGRTLRKFAQGAIEINEPRFSPDGKWIAYVVRVGAGRDVYVSPFPAGQSGGKWQVSVGGGLNPRWSRDGRELYYLSTDLHLMAVPVAPGSAFQAGPARKLSFAIAGGRRRGSNYEVGPPAKGFLMLDRPQDAQSEPIEILLNWQIAR